MMKRRPPTKYRKAYLSDSRKEIPRSTTEWRQHDNHADKRLKFIDNEHEVENEVCTASTSKANYNACGTSCSDQQTVLEENEKDILVLSPDSSTDHDESFKKRICGQVSSFGFHEDFAQEGELAVLADNMEAGEAVQVNHGLQVPQQIQESLFDDAAFDVDNPIFNGADVTKGQLLALLIAHCLKHGLSSAAMEDLLSLLNVVAPGCAPKTKWFMDKVFFNSSGKAEVHFYCRDCVKYIGKTVPDECPNCDNILSEKVLLDTNCYFLVMPLTTQIKNILQDNECEEQLRQHFHQHGSISDINTGRLYKEKRQFIENPDNITISFNCDGAPVFKSSKYSIWPILCTVNELPLQERKDNIMLHTLWFGPQKPHVDTYMMPFVLELEKLANEGMTWTNQAGHQKTTKVHALVCVCDAPARAMVQKFTQFNGAYGCGFCLAQGRMVQKGNGHTRVYPLVDPEPPLRSHEQTVLQAQVALDIGRPEMGVKGATPLLLIPSFNIIKGFVPDYMHSVCLGVVRQFTNLWFDTSTTEEAFHLKSRDLCVADEVLKTIKVPNEVKRNTRDLSERKFWKATEWRAFLLFYSPVLMKKLLPRRFYNHWMLLACAMHFLLLKNVTNDQVNVAELCLFKFVDGVVELYGEQYASYNVHLLTHLAQSVRDCGQLWANSAFIYEDTNGSLLELFHGTQAVPRQIFKYFLARLKLLRHSKPTFANATEQAKDLFHKLTVSDPCTSTAKYIFSDVVTLGKPALRNLSVGERVAIQNNLEFLQVHLPQQNDVVSVFKRCIIHNKMFAACDYGTGFLRDNSVLHTGAHYGSIISFVKVDKQCQCPNECHCSELLIFFNKLNRIQNQPSIWNNVIGHNISDFLVEVEESAEIGVCRAKDVGGKCICIRLDGRQFAIKMPTFELD